MTDYEVLYPENAAAWQSWLISNHATVPGIRLAIAKKGSGRSSVSHAEALDIALCFGWIDGRRNRLDDDYFLQVFTPRRPRSIWSQVNRDKVAQLIAAGRMQPAGLKEIERAKANGRWDAAYGPQTSIEVPEDLAVALRANPTAEGLFETLSRQNRFAVLFRIGNVRRAQTRARKIAEFVAMLERGETIYPQRGSRS